VRIVRFDAEVGRPIDAFGSDFLHVPVLDGRAHVAALHLPPGGRIGRHDAVATQVLAVVAGSGWAEDGEGNRVPLPAGRAAVWERGESHALSTDEGLTAIVLEGDLSVLATGTWRGPIVVADPDPAWAGWFRRVHDHVWPAVAQVALRIDHVGSTAVPGLAAKPIVDVDIVVGDAADVRRVNEALAGIGYRWRGDLGVPGREAYARVAVDPDLPPHHLYCVVDGNRAHLDHLLLRDLLREDAGARRRYGELKRRNAADADGDLDRYVKAKANLVAELLIRARAERGLEPVEYWDP
jgi:GrpB-like predicted nucleotidyltransferase (UPF0157 family)